MKAIGNNLYSGHEDGTIIIRKENDFPHLRIKESNSPITTMAGNPGTLFSGSGDERDEDGIFNFSGDNSVRKYYIGNICNNISS